MHKCLPKQAEKKSISEQGFEQKTVKMNPSTSISTSTATSTAKSVSTSSLSSTSVKKSPRKLKKKASSTASKLKNRKTPLSTSCCQHSTSSNNIASTSSQQPISVQANLNHLSSNSDHASPNSSGRDKSYQKTYAGFGANTIQCIWEQNDNSETEINADLLPVLAEDASYKLWELASNLKTFTRHSGGKLTTDIVNELLKDSSVPPMIGARAGNSEWDRVDYDGTYYYHADEIIDLRDEYLKEISSIQCGPLSLECNWVANQRNLKGLTKLWKSILLAIILGDDVAFQYTIHTTLINPFIGCILPYLIQKTIEYLAFGCTDDTLDRLLRFLKVILLNYHSRDVDNNEEYFNLCNLLVCLLLGTIDIKAKLESIKGEQTKCKPMKENATEAIPNALSIETKTKTEDDCKDLIKEDFMHTDKVLIKDEVDYSNDIYSKLVVNPAALGIKKETSDDAKLYDYKQSIKFEPNFYNADFQDEHLLYGDDKKMKIKTETQDANHEQCGVDGEANANELRDNYSPFVTDTCDDRFVEDVCSLMGYLASKWGYFEHEIFYLLTKRLEIFFYEERSWSTDDFKWLHRIIQALTSLGETAFREFTQYFECMPYDEQFPEWLKSQLNYGAIYIRGRKDFYFYEFMEEVCGDGLQPFMVYYAKYVEKMLKKSIALKQLQSQEPLKIAPKFLLKTILLPATVKMQTTHNFDDLFPERTAKIRKIPPTTRRIGFKFAGCCPVLAKPSLRLTSDQQFIQSAHLVSKFNSRIVICQKKLLSTIYINDCPSLTHLIDNRQYNL